MRGSLSLVVVCCHVPEQALQDGNMLLVKQRLQQ
jgi:hypothetical protein